MAKLISVGLALMRILAISYLFPNSIYPNYGIFVLNRLKAVAKYCEVKVINPIPWFPLSSKLQRYRNYHLIPHKEIIHGIEVFHPRFFIIPRLFKIMDCLSFCKAVLPLALDIRKGYPFDIIDLHWTYPDILAGTYLSHITGRKLLVTIRGNEALYLGEKGLRWRALNKLLPGADQIIALSQDLRSLCAIAGVDERKMEVIRNGVDTDLFQYIPKEKCRDRLGIPIDALVLLSVGSLTYGKGHDRILKALPNLLGSFPKLKLYILGSSGPAGDYTEDLFRMTSESGLEAVVSFRGEVRNEDLPLWYSAADCFCLASRGEGSPNVLNEALACGCPSVATDVGAVTEILSEEYLGTVVENEDESLAAGLLATLARTYDHPRIASRLRQHDWDWCAREVVRVYRKVLA